jgi:osmotically-inducible protein OsmY
MITDLDIKQHVLDELDWDPAIDASRIGVIVNQGIVTLSGQVPTFKEKSLAEKIAARIHGVKAVIQEIEVVIPGEARQTDEVIAQAAVSALKWYSGIPDSVTVTVENGWLTVSGTVNWNHQKNDISKALRNLTGIRGLSNRVSVKPIVQPFELQQRIRKALERQAQLDAVTIEGGKVTLEGVVQSLAEKKQAQREAWAAPGVSEVNNRIQVQIEEPAY